MRTRSYSRGAIAILLTFGLVSGGGIAASATTPPPTSKSIQDNESFEDDLADGFEVLFTEILQLDSNGTWKINEGELSKHPEIDRAKINEVALALTELERLEGSGKLSETRYQTQGKKEFGMCVLKGIIPGAGLVSIDWGKVYSYIKQKLGESCRSI